MFASFLNIREKEDDGQQLCMTQQPTGVKDCWVIWTTIGSGRLPTFVLDTPAFPVPEMQIRGTCYVTWQHPCSLYCTPKSETTASALLSPAVGLSNQMNERYKIPEHWVHFQVVQSIVAVGRTQHLFSQPALRAGAFSEVSEK